MSNSDQPSESDEPVLPKDFRMRPSGNHKKRSRLRQATEEESPAPPEPEPIEPPPQAPLPDTPPYMRKFRMKRSGQMHDDLNASVPVNRPPPPRESEY